MSSGDGDGTGSGAGDAFMENLMRLFADCDLDNSGSLVESEFKELCSKIGLSAEVATETFNRLDIDKNGQITFEEFAAGFQQYRQAATVGAGAPSGLVGAQATTSGQNHQKRDPGEPGRSPSSSFKSASSGGGAQKLSPSPVTSRARSRASQCGAAPTSLGSTGAGSSSSSGNLTASGRSTSSSGGTQYDMSSSYELNSSCDLAPLQQSLSANDLVLGSPAVCTSNSLDHQQQQQQQPAALAPAPSQDDVIVYSSEAIGSNGGNTSGQFGSLMSSGSSYSQVKTMQDLLECVQKLQNENQILTQIFFKDKREREEYISQLGEEFDQQLREVEERANKRAREELESEKRRLREMMQAERETLQHHYQTLEKMSKMVRSPHGSGAGGKGETDEGLFKVKSQLEDTFNENRQLKKSLLDTKTDVALIWKEMEKLKKQYEVKLSSAYEKQRKTQYECDHIKKQLNLMQDSNRKLQDASDVITNYIADKVEPVIKVALDGAEGDECNSLNGGLKRANSGSGSSSRRGSILSEYLANNGGDQQPAEGGNGGGSERGSSVAGDLDSVASSVSAAQTRWAPPTKANGMALEGSDLERATPKQKGEGENRLEVPKTRAGKRPVMAETNGKGPSCEPKRGNKQDEQKALEAKKSGEQAAGGSLAGGKSSLRSLGRHFALGSRSSSSSLSEAKRAGSLEEAKSAGKPNGGKSASADLAQEGPAIEPADGPSVADFNIILVGDSFVGKSSFAARFIEGNFVQGLISNCSIDFKAKAYKVDGVNYTVNLWDTARANGIILMYDVTDKRSYLNCRNWMSTIADTAAENVAVLLVGNKIDLRHNENKANCVPTEEGFRLAKEYDIVFLETSVKTGTNLLPSMAELIRLIAKNNTAQEEDTDRIKLSDKSRTFNCMPKSC